MFIDWDGNGRIDPVDVGISIAAENMHEESEQCAGERIALISCSKSKQSYRCRASEMYSASTLFSLSYEYALANADRIYIISAKHGLLAEDEVIEPYNETLNEKSTSERRAWAKRVLEQLRQECDVERDEFVILAGKRYYEYLLPELPHATLPLGNLPLGKRIEFLQRAQRASMDYRRSAPEPGPVERKKRKKPLLERKAERPRWGVEPLMELKAGERVCHGVFGNGTVISVRNMANRRDAVVEVEFDERGRKKLLLSIAGRQMRVLR